MAAALASCGAAMVGFGRIEGLAELFVLRGHWCKGEHGLDSLIGGAIVVKVCESLGLWTEVSVIGKSYCSVLELEFGYGLEL